MIVKRIRIDLQPWGNAITEKPMKEFIFVTEEGYNTEERLQHWLELGITHAKTKV